jgi:hypothetical protein
MHDRIALLESRLGDIALVLENDPDGLALLGLGSAGLERERLDEWSDLDFFAIVRPGSKARFLSDPSWLGLAHPVSYLFRNTADGFKLLFADGVFGEMAVFEPAELSSIPFSPGAVIWCRPGFDATVLSPSSQQGMLPQTVDVDHAVGELVTCLYVGMCRYRRGEFLSAWRFVQVYCLDRVLELASVWYPPAGGFPDRYVRDRRAEVRHPDLVPLIERVLVGYSGTPSAARAILAWLESRVAVNAALKAEILRLAS